MVVRELIMRNVLNVLEVVSLSGQEYTGVIDHLADLGVVGGATYDALILQTAMKANADQVVTLNERHFRQVQPDLAEKIISP
jgi:predicted nucleic acid-binding protein